jgi:putative glutamine amidotransferase
MNSTSPGRERSSTRSGSSGLVRGSPASADRMTVKTHHHQGLDELGAGLVATGWSEPDGIVEAIEPNHEGFALGVLWHPEEHPTDSVIASFVAAVPTRASGWRVSFAIR